MNLQKHGRFGRAFWGRTGMSGRGSVVEGGGVSPHQLCLLWRLIAAVGSFALTHSPFPPRSHCSPDIASYAKKPSASFIPPPPPPGGRRSVSERGFTDYADISIGCQDGTRQLMTTRKQNFDLC